MFKAIVRFLNKDFGYVSVGLNETGRSFSRLYYPAQVLQIVLLYWYHHCHNNVMLVPIAIMAVYLLALFIQFGFVRKEIADVVGDFYSCQRRSMNYGLLAVFWSIIYIAANALFLYAFVFKH